MNARSIVNKIPEFLLLLTTAKFDIIFICETWLNASLPDSIITIRDYHVYRSDRETRRGGGVAIFYKKSLNLKNIQVKHDLDLHETIICELTLNTTLRFLLCYRAPDYDITHANKLTSLLTWATSYPHPLIFLGDLNLPQINWTLNECTTDPIHSTLYTAITNLGLEQLVTNNTRLNNCLDLIFCNSLHTIYGLQIKEPFSNSDHNTIDFFLNIRPQNNHHNNSITNYNFNKANYDIIDADLSSLDWQTLFSDCNTVDDYYNIFLLEMQRVIKLYVPLTIIKTKKNKLPIKIRKLQSKKRSLWRKNKTGYVVNFKSRYKNLCHQIKTACTNYHINQEENLLHTKSTRAFYNFVNNKLKDSRSIPPLKGPNGKDYNNETNKANIFNTFFSSVFVNSNGSSPIFPSRTTNNCNDLTQIDFTEDIIEKALRNLKPSQSIGPDGLCAYFLKKLSSTIAEPLSIIFKKSFRTSFLPKLWSLATVIPIFKKGDPSNVENYRPISLCCVTCKVMESIINQSITLHLETNNLLSNKQFGFRKKLSCNLQLLHCKNIWTTHLDQGKSIDSIYIDFCKAFDSVVHDKLLLKLKSYGISGPLHDWITAFLSNRQQVVKIGSSLSNPAPVNSGVPQGSVLGPTLFILYINDLCDHITSNCVLFADDVKLFNTTDNTSTLQKDLDHITEWSDNWQLQISSNKCSVLHIGKKNENTKYKLGGHDLVDDPHAVKDLGVLISNDLSARAHCNNIAKKALRVINLILRSFFSGNIKLLTRAYLTFARPILEYSSPVWNPYYISDINTIERVQKYFTRRILHSSAHNRIPYPTRLEILGLDSLELRRLRTDLNVVHKIIYHNVLPVNDFFSFNRNNTRAHNRFKLNVNRSKLNCRKYDFSNRVVNAWNALPDSVVSSPNPKTFNLRLSTFDLTPFLRGL